MTPRPRVSVIFATHNRRSAVMTTLQRLRTLGFAPSSLEIIAVDNASTDGTVEYLRQQTVVRLVALRKNHGSTAKAAGVRFARAPVIVFLDDDSFPRGGALEQALARFEHDPRLGALGFSVHLPDCRRECSALPHVFVGCGVAFSAAALRRVGGLDRTFFMQAEEYDLSFRLANAGWKVEVSDELQVDHLKTPQARSSAHRMYFDIRNNLRVIGRHLDGEAAAAYGQDWMQRYAWLAEADGHADAFARGLVDGRRLAAREAGRFAKLSAGAFEHFFSWDAIAAHLKNLAAIGARRVVLVQMGKNIYAFYRAAARAGLEIAAIADTRFAGPQRGYRGVPLVSLEEGLRMPADAFIIADTSHVHAAAQLNDLHRRGVRSVYCWFSSSAGCSPVAAPGSSSVGNAPGSSSCGGRLPVLMDSASMPQASANAAS